MLQRIRNQTGYQQKRDDYERVVCFNDMPLEVQQRVFGKVKQVERVTKLPLVCKQWKEGLEVPSMAWSEFRFAPMLHQGDQNCYLLGDLKQKVELKNYKNLESWLRQRISGMKAIKISDRFGSEEKCKKIYSAIINNLSDAQDLESLQLAFQSSIVVDQFLPSCKHLLTHITDLSLETWNMSFSQERAHALSYFTNLKSLTIGALQGYGDNAKQPILQGFPQGILSLTNLEFLQVRSRGVTTVPSEISQLSNLKVLNLESCLISSLPMSLQKMTTLQQLNLSKNRVAEFIYPLLEVICTIPNLQTLDLSSNQLQDFTINPAWTISQSLQQLNISSNYLEQLPRSFSMLQNLQLLNLSKNPLKVVPEVLANLAALNTVDLSSCRFLQHSTSSNQLMQKADCNIILPTQLQFQQEQDVDQEILDWLNSQSPFQTSTEQQQEDLNCGAVVSDEQDEEQSSLWGFFGAIGRMCSKLSTISNRLSQVFPDLEVEWF